jgi:hypothetical protein
MRSLGIALAAIVACPVAFAQSDAAQYQAAKAVFEQWKDAVVTVKLVRKMQMVVRGREMNSREAESEISGTVVHESGLTVVSLFASDPENALAEWMPDEDFKMESRISQAKIVLPDGKEIPGKVVLRDKDLDLAYIRPDDKSLKLTGLPLENGAPLSILDPVILLSRLDRSADRAPTVRIEHVSAVVEKPRRMYVLGMSLGSINDLGCPVLDGNGKAAGLMLIKLAPAAARQAMVSGITPVVLPAAQVAEITKQALAAPEPPAAEEAPQSQPSEESEEEAVLPTTTQAHPSPF